MNDGVTIQVRGATAIIRALARLEKREAKKIIRRALRMVAKKITERAKMLAPVDTGRLKRAIRTRAGKRSRRYIAVVSTIGEGQFQGETFYGGFQEWGWKTGKRGSDNRRDVPGKHFMQGAAEQVGPQAAEAATQQIAAELGI